MASKTRIKVVLALSLALACLVVGCQVLEARYERACKVLLQARHVSEIESALGPALAEYAVYHDIHRDHSSGIYAEQDEKAGLVLRIYALHRAAFHIGYQDLVVKVRPSDGAILAAKAYQP